MAETVPPIGVAKDLGEMHKRGVLYKLPNFYKMTDSQVEWWVEHETRKWLLKAKIEDRDVAETLATQIATHLYMYGMAYEGIRQAKMSGKPPSLSDLTKASNIASKIPRLMRSLGLVVLYKDVENANKKSGNKDPFAEDGDG